MNRGRSPPPRTYRKLGIRARGELARLIAEGTVV
jgi:hypothetical protein